MPSKNRPKEMAAECGGLYFMFLAPLLSKVSGPATVSESTTEIDAEKGNCRKVLVYR